ncbi:MAG: AMP-binding protein [Candidatus Omnitrophota bacterium]
MTERDTTLSHPWKELKARQDRKLRHFIRSHLYPFSHYYRRLFDRNRIRPEDIRTVEDLAKIPFTSKKTLLEPGQEDPQKRTLDFLLRPKEELIKKYLPKGELLKFISESAIRGKKRLTAHLAKEYKPIFLTATAGTTNRPLSFLYTDYDLENLKIYGRRLFDVFDIKSDEIAVSVFPYAPHLAFWATVFGGIAANVFILSTGGGKTLGTEGNIRSIIQVKPKFLIGVPSYVYHVIKTAKEQGVSFNFLNRVILGAGRVPRGFKQKLVSMLSEMGARDIRVFSTYGFTESRCAWGECPTEIDVSSGYHTYPDKEVFEIIDPDTGEVKGEGEDGEIVYSNIDARGSCVLRYRTGDLVKGGITYNPCPHCGRTAPRISSDIIRASNIKSFQLSKVKDSLVNLNGLERLLDNQPEIDEWQIEIIKKDNDPYEVDQLVLHASLLSNLDKEKFSVRINQIMIAEEEITFNRICFVSRKEIKKMIEIESSVKAKKIVDRRPNV